MAFKIKIKLPRMCALAITTTEVFLGRRSDGTVLVLNPRSPEETLVQTNLDELWPIAI